MIGKAAARLLTACLVVFTSFTTMVYAADVPAPVGHIYVQDFANVLYANKKMSLFNTESN